MRQITKEAVNAFISKTAFIKSNTAIVLDKEREEVTMSLFGNLIAKRNTKTDKVEISTSGFNTSTTKERLNGLLEKLGLGRPIRIKNNELYFDNNVWLGEWMEIF